MGFSDAELAVALRNHRIGSVKSAVAWARRYGKILREKYAVIAASTEEECLARLDAEFNS